jgi:hypothetical protein
VNLDLQLEFDLAGLTFFMYSLLMGFAVLTGLLAAIVAG